MSLHVRHLYLQGNRWQDRAVEEKLLWSLGLLALSLLVPVFPGSLLVIASASALALLSAGVNWKVYFPLLLYPLSFVFLGALAMPLSVTFDNGLALKLAPSSMSCLLAPGLRSLAAFCSLLLLALTTPATDLIPFLRAIAPAELVEIALMAHRLIFVFGDTAEQMQQAQDARLGYRSMPAARRSIALLLSALFLTTLDRARRMENALSARGYWQQLRVLKESPPLRLKALASVGAALLALLILSFLGRDVLCL